MIKLRLAALLAACLLSACVTTPTPSPGTGLERLVEAYFDESLALNPVDATFVGEHRYDDRLELTPSPAYQAAAVALERRYRDAVSAIGPGTLSAQDRLTREMFLYGRDRALESFGFPGRLLPISQFYGGMATVMAILGSGTGPQPFATMEDHQRWWRRARQFPGWVDAAIDAMREGMAQGVVQPRSVMVKALPQMEQLIAARPEDSEFYAPVRMLPAGLANAELEAAETEYARLVTEVFNPGYRRLHDFIRDEYLPACRDSSGWSALPDGAAWYASLVRQHTTSSMTPEEIHALGLREVARIRSGMEEVMRQAGFSGDLQAFFLWVQEDPSFYYQHPAQLLQGYRELKRRIDAALPALFAEFPKADYEVREVETFRAASAAGASYLNPSPDGSRPGIFYINTHNLRAQPIYGMETLSLHEAAPGHHFQISIQQELTGLPRFRRFEGNVAYVEGWALYAESLGRELGLFTDPMQWYGRLSDEMLRAMRLVVDTGLHTMGWSREQAIRYMHENSSLAASDIEAEVERYMVNPGQALGYKVGDLRIQALRRRAERELGPRFDVREFHSQVLRDGALPLDVLEAKIDRWIAGVAAR